MENVLKEVVKYNGLPYDLLKIKPDSRLTGTVYYDIIKAIYSLYKPINERFSQQNISKYNSNIQVQMNNPVTYEIMFDGDDKKTTPIFCFGIPASNSTYIKQRIQGILPQSTLTFEEDYVDMFSDSYVVEYNYQKDSMLALKTSENNFLQMMLNLKNDINKGEKILFQVEMTPISSMWKSFQDDKWDKIRGGKDVATKRGIVDRGLDFANDTVNSVLSLIDDVMDYNPPKKEKSITETKKEYGIKMSAYSTSSRNKKNDDGFSVKVRAYIVCGSKMIAKAYATSIDTCMRELEEDNRLVQGNIKIGNVKRGFGIKNLIPIGRNIMSGKELASIVNIPNKKLQREFKIDSINVKQVSAPKECMDSGSGVRIGAMTIHGDTLYVYFPNSRDLLAMPRYLLCGMGGGKSTALLNQCLDIIEAGQGVIDINYTSKCELAYALKDRYDHHVLIDLSDENNLPALKLPEIIIYDTDSIATKKRKADDAASEVEYFVNCITAEGADKITVRMGQYLHSSAKIVFIYNNMKVRTVFDILDDKNIRGEWIEKALNSGVYKEEDYEIRKLRELDDDPKGSKVSGILDRYSVLMRNSTTQTMLDGDNCMFDFIDIMDNGKSISICMPEECFRNKKTKDIIIAYLMCRIRLAMLVRKDRDKVCHVVLDEAHHLDSSLNVIADSVAEVRKYGISLCFATHFFNQMGVRLKEAALDVGGHFMLLKGVSETVFETLKTKIGEDWTYDDMKELEPRHTLNMILIDQEHKIFTSKMLPPPLDKDGVKYIQ